MARIRKASPPPFVVVVDTNILWCEDKSVAVIPSFDLFWDQYSSEFLMELVLPEIVVSELKFQQVTSALKAMDRATEAFKQVAAITASSHSPRLKVSKIRDQVIMKIERWIKTKSARVHASPVGKIAWEKLIQKAVWREPPFSYDPKDPKNEKGFRDAIILETFQDIVATDTRTVNMVFISNDGLLRKAVETMCKSDSRCSIYQSVDDFTSYLRLTKEKLTDQFIKSLVSKAAKKFFTKSDPTCIFYKDNIKERVRSENKEKFDNPEAVATLSLTSLIQSASSMPSWEGPDGKWWIYQAQFEKLVGEKQYYWKSPIKFVRLFSSKPSVASQPSLVTNEIKLQILSFSVVWWANVKADGRFHDMTVDKVEFESGSFEPPDTSQLKDFNLERSNET